MKTLCVIACHSDTDLKVQCATSNIKYFKEISDKIVIINSKESKHEELRTSINDDNISHVLYDNDNTLCHGKWLRFLKDKDQYKDFDFIILTNDSFLVINDLKIFKRAFISNGADAYGLVNNREIKYHHQDFLKIYKKQCIPTLVSYYEDELSKYINNDTPDKFIEEYPILTEVNSTFLFKNVDCLYNIDLRFKYNINFNDDILQQCIEENGYPIIKIKRLTSKTSYDSFPEDFDPKIYKDINKSLEHMDDKEATEHFINHGMGEGRLYKHNQPVNLPKFIKTALQKEGITYE